MQIYNHVVLALSFWLGLAATSQSQIPPASQLLPEGFKVATERRHANMILVEAKKNNANFPKPHMDQGIVLSISWSANAAASTTVQMLARQPEDPESTMGVTREEPAGKTPHRNGVLTWRKTTTAWVGSGNAPDLVTWRGGWTGAAFGGLLGISISNFFGSKEQALGLIDSVIEKIAPNR